MKDLASILLILCLVVMVCCAVAVVFPSPKIKDCEEKYEAAKAKCKERGQRLSKIDCTGFGYRFECK
jgi:hypothetical protein